MFEEQRQLHLPQKHKATVADSTLRVEMNGLEEQADNAKARELFWKPLSWLGTIRPTSANDAFDPALWETFVSTTLGLEVPMMIVLLLFLQKQSLAFAVYLFGIGTLLTGLGSKKNTCDNVLTTTSKAPW